MDRSDLDPNPEAFGRLAAQALDLIGRQLGGLDHAPVYTSAGGAALATALREPTATEGPTPWPELLDIVDKGLSVTYNTASGGYLAYVPGGGLPVAALGDLLAGALNRYVGVWRAAPGLVELEQNVIRRFAEIVGYKGAHGFLTSGGSLANFSALVTAREEKLGPDIRQGVLYTSAEAHHSVQKAGLLGGIRADRIRIVPHDTGLRLDPEALRSAVEADRAAGLTPFCVVAQAGSTNTGVVDNLHALADLCADENLWLHVDGAYGGFFGMTTRGRQALDGLNRADSITLDPHKGLFLPYGTGCLLVQKDGVLQRAHDVSAAYMPAMADGAEHIDYCAISPELSRPFRGLAVWLALRLHGQAAFAAALDEKIDLARRLYDHVAARDDVSIITEPALSLFAFRFERPGLVGAERDAYNQAVLDKVASYGRVFLTGTHLADHGFVGRACVLHFRTRAAHIEACVEDIDRAVKELS